ncbi:secreted protein [Apiospora phragmitis]|uniref:Secreted protein n=1 Tax=Apiospora phragmitis TaxID=2905665 RepID=A0ABR1TU71_9PEZI
MFIDFPDAISNSSEPQSLFDSHAAAMEEWYHTSSYSKLSLQINGDTQQIYRMPATAASYQWEGGITSFHLMKYVQDALDAYMQAHDADASIFPEMDILYLGAPPSATFSNSYTYMYEPEVRMPNGIANTTVGTAVAKRAVAFGHDLYGGFNQKGFKALAHETAHTRACPTTT